MVNIRPTRSVLMTSEFPLYHLPKSRVSDLTVTGMESRHTVIGRFKLSGATAKISTVKIMN